MPFAQHTSGDVFSQAMTEQPQIGYGKINADVYQVVFIGNKDEKKKKVSYNPQDPEHQQYNPAVEIAFKITPLDATKPIQTIFPMLDGSPEWKKIVRPSLRNIASQVAAIRSVDPEDKNFVVLREILGLFVRYVWVLKPNNPEGKDYKTICFTNVYPDEATCQEAAKKEGAIAAEAMDNALPFPSGPTVADLDTQRAALKAFLEPYWKQAKGDQKAFAEMLTKPPFNGLFTLDSDEVKSAMTPF